MGGSSWIVGREGRNSGGRKGASSPPKVKAGGGAGAGSTGFARDEKTGWRSRQSRQGRKKTPWQSRQSRHRRGNEMTWRFRLSVSPLLRRSGGGSIVKDRELTGRHHKPAASSVGKTAFRIGTGVETADEFRLNPTIIPRIASTASRLRAGPGTTRRAEASTSGAGLFTDAARAGADRTRRLLW